MRIHVGAYFLPFLPPRPPFFFRVLNLRSFFFCSLLLWATANICFLSHLSTCFVFVGWRREQQGSSQDRRSEDCHPHAFEWREAAIPSHGRCHFLFVCLCVCVCVCKLGPSSFFFCLAWLGLVWLTLEFVNRCVLCRCCAFSSSQSVIRYVMPFDDHTLKKLLLVFWEIVPKYDASGKLLQEMILVCDAYRKVGFNHGFVFVCL